MLLFEKKLVYKISGKLNCLLPNRRAPFFSITTVSPQRKNSSRVPHCGLARSSRNRYLDATQRRLAVALIRALRAGADVRVDPAQFLAHPLVDTLVMPAEDDQVVFAGQAPRNLVGPAPPLG